MRTLMTLALAATTFTAAHATLWGASLAYANQISSTTGSALASGNLGVTGGAYTASQMTSATKTSAQVPIQVQSTGNIYYTVGIHAYWLNNGDTPPATIYLNSLRTANCFATTNRYGPGGPESYSASGSIGSLTVTHSSSTPYGVSNIQSNGYVLKSSDQHSVQWLKVGELNGVDLMRTVDPIELTLPEAAVSGSVGFAPIHMGTTTCVSNSSGSLGISFFIAPGPYL